MIPSHVVSLSEPKLKKRLLNGKYKNIRIFQQNTKWLDYFYPIRCLTFLLTLMLHNIPAYPRMAENTNKMQDIIQVDIAENPSTFGDIAITELNILINTKKSVTSKDILPATI